MSAPPNVRVNIGAPFPSLIKTSAGIGIAKANGIWTVGLSFSNLGVQAPPFGNFPNDYIAVYDSVAQTFFKMSLSALATAAINAGRLQRSITTAPDLPIRGTDSILNINAVTDLAPVVPKANTRAGVPLTFKLLPASAQQTITRTSPDTFDGNTTIILTGGQTLTLMPYNDGVNAGYAIE